MCVPVATAISRAPAAAIPRVTAAAEAEGMGKRGAILQSPDHKHRREMQSVGSDAFSSTASSISRDS